MKIAATQIEGEDGELASRGGLPAYEQGSRVRPVHAAPGEGPDEKTLERYFPALPGGGSAAPRRKRRRGEQRECGPPGKWHAISVADG